VILDIFIIVKVRKNFFCETIETIRCLFYFFWWQKKQNQFLCNQRNRKLILALRLSLRFTMIALRAKNSARKACRGLYIYQTGMEITCLLYALSSWISGHKAVKNLML